MLKINKMLSSMLLLSGGCVFAGTMGPVCKESPLTVPCDMKKWSLSGQAIYMQMPTGNNLSRTTLTGSLGSVTKGGEPGWNWGFQLEGAYHFSNGKDIDLNWYHLRGSRGGSLPAPVALGSVYLPQTPTGISSPVSSTNVIVEKFDSNVNTGWDMVNIEHGRQINFDEEFYARVHFGGEYSRVAQNVDIANSGTSGIDSTLYSIATSIDSVYNGFGPRLGVDLVYETQSGLGFYGKGAFGLLAGTAKTNYTQTNTSNITSNLYYNVVKVTTSTDAKLGVNYFHDLRHGKLMLDAGWMWVNYLNALSAQSAMSGSDNNSFGIQGLYFGAKWIGDFI